VIAILVLSVSSTRAVPFISQETEITWGQGGDRQVIQQYGLYSNKPLQLYINRIGQKLVSNLNNKEFSRYFFKVVDSSEINAFALPGGYIYVTRGLLATLNNEAELAGVLGHEIGHVVLHHGAKHVARSVASTILSLGGAIASPKNAGNWLLVSTQMFNAINLGYGRQAELDSDAHGILTSFESGYNPETIVDFLSNLRQHEILSGQAYHSFQATHPDTKERVVKASILSQSMSSRAESELVKRREVYLQQIQGMAYGGKRYAKDPRQYKDEYIDIYQVKPGDTFQSIATQELADNTKDLEIAVINGMKNEEKPKPGSWLKLVRKGTYQKEKKLELHPGNFFK